MKGKLLRLLLTDGKVMAGKYVSHSWKGVMILPIDSKDGKPIAVAWNKVRSDVVVRLLKAAIDPRSAKDHLLLASGNGDLIEPDDGICAVGSGGPYALAAARALAQHSDLSAVEIVREAMNITADICIYTNRNLTIEVI